MKILKELAKYCSGEISVDTLNKMSELITLTAMKKKGNMHEMKQVVFEEALAEWKEGNITPTKFKQAFRGGN